MHARGVALDPSVDLNTIAARTPGFTGADLENVVNEAALLAARREKNAVSMEELERAIRSRDRGPRAGSHAWSRLRRSRWPFTRWAALVALSAVGKQIDPLHRVTIIPRAARRRSGSR